MFQLVNVPSGIWIDEKGLVVRPPETAYTADQTLRVGNKSIETQGKLYVEALRDWVRNGAKSVYALSDDEWERRVKPRSNEHLLAEASFKLAVHLQASGDAALAAKHFARAQQLHPENWNYHRQEWSFTPSEAGRKWLDKFQKTEQPYYPKLEFTPK